MVTETGVDSSPSRPLQPVNLEIPAVSEEVYNKTREALAKEGLTYVVTIEPISMGQLATDEATINRFGNVNSSENMRAIVPPRMEVAIDPKNIRIKNSNSKSTDTQRRMTRDQEAKLKAKLPIDVRDVISMLMPNASTLALVEFDFQGEFGGKPLYPDFFIRTDDETVSGYVANVGRSDPSDRLGVDERGRDRVYDDVFASRVVVLPRKL